MPSSSSPAPRSIWPRAALRPSVHRVEVHLPGLDGLALQRKLTEEGRPKQIVFITRRGDLPMGIGAMKRGAVDFLPKPFKNEELLSAVALALARSAEAAESRARLAKLTPREFEVFRLVVAGLVNKRSARNSASRFARLRHIEAA